MRMDCQLSWATQTTTIWIAQETPTTELRIHLSILGFRNIFESWRIPRSWCSISANIRFYGIECNANAWSTPNSEWSFLLDNPPIEMQTEL